MFAHFYYVPSDVIITQRINRQIRVWHSLVHPNVLPFLGLSHDIGPSPAFISPLCKNLEGWDIYNNNRIQANIPMLASSLHIPCRTMELIYIYHHPFQILGVAKGLQYLHSRNVIHGSLDTVKHAVSLHHFFYSLIQFISVKYQLMKLAFPAQVALVVQNSLIIKVSQPSSLLEFDSRLQKYLDLYWRIPTTNASTSTHIPIPFCPKKVMYMRLV